MRRGVAITICLFLTLTFSAQNGGKQQLVKLFNEAEQCYLIDDYQQLDVCIKQYADVFSANQSNLGDSVDIYRAYYAKMYGSYLYGHSDDKFYVRYSEEMYRKSLNVFNKMVGTSQINGMHPNAVTLHQELAQLFYKAKDYNKAKEQLDTVFLYYEGKLFDGIDSFRPEYYKTISQLAMCNARLGHFDIAESQIDESINDYFSKVPDVNYFEALRKKGKILMLRADSLGGTYYKQAIDCYQQYVSGRIEDIGKEMTGMTESQRNQYWLATHQFLYDCTRLGNHAPEMLYDLALYSKDYLVRKDADQTRWTHVKESLGEKDCAIEFLQYFGKKDEKRLGCLVLRKNSKKPLFLDLFSADSLLSLPLTNQYTIGKAITTTTSTIKNDLYNDEQLPQIVWSESLMKAIGNAKNVFFAPDGLLHLLAIEYMMPDTTKVCYRLSSTRNLTQQRTATKMESALLCGGIKYGSSFLPEEGDNDIEAYRFLTKQATDIKDLIWARQEVESIYALRNNENDKLLVGEDATDEAFLRYMKQHYRLIHLSTHGYYGGTISIYNDIKPLLDDNSMSKCGLLFAGSANTLADKDFDENMSDGILSATELSRQDLRKTELVVLSACQTGQGKLTDDGIYGIQRGLKLAGANSMILTLWNVNDYSSCMLMRFFYEELGKQSSKDIHAAFLKARQRLIEEERTTCSFDASSLTVVKKIIRYNTPQHVNPFIIIDTY